MEVLQRDNLTLGGFPEFRKGIIVQAGEGALRRGSILGRVTANKKYRILNVANSDGSETARAILLEDVDADAQDSVAVAAFTGVFNRTGLSVGGGGAVGDHEDALSDRCIFISDTQSA